MDSATQWYKSLKGMGRILNKKGIVELSFPQSPVEVNPRRLIPRGKKENLSGYFPLPDTIVSPA
jgi:hypothetical protein